MLPQYLRRRRDAKKMESQQTYNLSRNFSASATPRANSPSK